MDIRKKEGGAELAGAAFDFITGKVPQAPMWMQRSGPAHRCLVYNPLFIMHVFMQIHGLHQYSYRD